LDIDFAAYTQGNANRFISLYEAMDFEESIVHAEQLSRRLDAHEGAYDPSK
jgi:hypothetical protein